MSHDNDDIYTIISASEGDVTIEQLPKALLIKRLNEGYWSDPPMAQSDFDALAVKSSSGNNWFDFTAHGGLLILKGSLVSPTAKQVVKEWDL